MTRKERYGMALYKAPVLHNREAAKDIFIIEVEYHGKNIVPLPGQFFNILSGAGYDPLLRRPISVGGFEDGRLTFYYKVVGDGTRAMSLLKAGDIIDMMGPLGSGFDLLPGRSLLIGGGIGIAPLVYLSGALKNIGGDVSAILGFAASKDMYIAGMPGAESVTVFTADGSEGKKGYPTDDPALISGADQIYSCGPLAMMKNVAKIAAEARIEAFYSLEEKMACGIGACLGCALKTASGMKMVCKDGPVFKGSDLLWT